MNNTPRTSEERLTAYHSEEFEIIRSVRRDGTVSYHHPNSGDEISTHTNSIEEIHHSVLNRFSSLVDIMSDEDYSKIGFIFEALIRDAEQQFMEIEVLIKKQIGAIEVVCVSHGNWIYRSGRVIEARLNPANEQVHHE